MPLHGDRPHGARPLAGQLLRRDRAGRVLPGQHRARHRLLATTRCCRAGCSPTSTRSSRAWARPNFHQIPINAPKCPFANHQRDGHMQMTQPKGRVNYEPSSLERRTRRARARGTASAASRSAETGEQGAHPRRDLRRPLQPGAPVLPQPDRARAGAHGLGAGVRAVEGGAPARARGDGRPPAQHRRATWPSASPTAWRLQAAARGAAGRGARARPAAVAGPADHRQDEGHARGPRGRHPRRRRLRRRRRRGAAQGGRRAPAPRSRSSRPRSAARSWPDGVQLAADGQLAGTPSVLFDAVAVVLSADAAPRCSQGERGASTSCATRSATSRRSPSTAAAQALLDSRRRREGRRRGRGGDAEAFIAAAKTRQWAREPKVRTLA